MRRGPWRMVWLRDFSGGLNTRKAPHALSANEWAELTNVRLDEAGAVKKRGGTTKKTANVLVRYE